MLSKKREIFYGIFYAKIIENIYGFFLENAKFFTKKFEKNFGLILSVVLILCLRLPRPGPVSGETKYLNKTETKTFSDTVSDFFSIWNCFITNFSKPILFFDTQKFWYWYWYFFWYQFFSNPIQFDIKPDQLEFTNAVSGVLEQLCKLYPGDQKLSCVNFARRPVYIKKEIAEAYLNNCTMIDLENVDTILCGLVEKEIYSFLEAPVSLTLP